MAEKNFHRSLDHRSFYFKQHEKKLTNQKSKRPKPLGITFKTLIDVDFILEAKARYCKMMARVNGVKITFPDIKLDVNNFLFILF
jgi:histone deacetylase complex regulatory component SIN3